MRGFRRAHSGGCPRTTFSCRIYMLIVAPVRKNIRRTLTEAEKALSGLAKLRVARSTIPAVTHVDYSARVQIVTKNDHPLFYEVIAAFEKQHGCATIINTSFNVRGEPIVCSPQDAYRCFMRTNMDYLVMGNYLLDKEKQKPLDNDNNWMHEFKND